MWIHVIRLTSGSDFSQHSNNCEKSHTSTHVSRWQIHVSASARTSATLYVHRHRTKSRRLRNARLQLPDKSAGERDLRLPRHSLTRESGQSRLNSHCRRFAVSRILYGESFLNRDPWPGCTGAPGSCGNPQFAGSRERITRCECSVFA